MDNLGLLDSLWEILNERLWHATGPERLCGIVKDKEIKITGDRNQKSLCRFLNCVSLFDFGPTAVDEGNQYRIWIGWFGDQQVARVAIWLEIDRNAAATVSLMQELCFKSGRITKRKRLFLVWKLATKEPFLFVI